MTSALFCILLAVWAFGCGWLRGVETGERRERERRARKHAREPHYEQQYDIPLVDQAARINGAKRVPIRHHTNPHARN